MPPKRRLPKRNSQIELAAWSETFTTGYDDYHDLEPLGLEGDAVLGSPEYLKAHALVVSHTDPVKRQNHSQAYQRAREAWDRLGGTFLAAWAPADPDARPWALEAFGEPRGGSYAG